MASSWPDPLRKTVGLGAGLKDSTSTLISERSAAACISATCTCVVFGDHIPEGEGINSGPWRIFIQNQPPSSVEITVVLAVHVPSGTPHEIRFPLKVKEQLRLSPSNDWPTSKGSRPDPRSLLRMLAHSHQ